MVTAQRGVPVEPTAGSGPRRPEPERPHFDMVLRGYDRIEVDEYIERLLAENAALRRELESAAARVPGPREEPGEATQVMAPPVPTPPSPVPPVQAPAHSYDIDTPAEDSFGFRAEKLLRLAEREAVEMRTRATRDAEGVEAAARRRADEQLRAAERDADTLRERAGQEAARVGRLHRATREELRRLAGLLNAELERPDPAEGPVDTAEHPAPGAPDPRTGPRPSQP